MCSRFEACLWQGCVILYTSLTIKDGLCDSARRDPQDIIPSFLHRNAYFIIRANKDWIITIPWALTERLIIFHSLAYLF